MLVSKSSVSLIWIYIHSQLQTNMWDAFQGCDSITRNYVSFTWISSWNDFSKWGCIASQDMNSTILLFYCECVMEGSKEKNNDWNKGAWIINTVVKWRWWRRVGLIEFQEGCNCQEIIQFFSFKKQAGTFCVTEIMWLGQVCLKFRLVILCLFLKEDVKVDKFHCLPCFVNPSITERKNFLLLWNWAHTVHIFLKLLSWHFFSRFD